MATYIQGVTDYIPQIQPFQVDLNFYGNIMQNKQSQYDAAKKKVGDLYGSLLNSPMSRDSNIQRRDNFFKIIDQDIQKISGLDLSLQQNQDAAMNVFSGFYDDKYMVNDMVKTRNFGNEMQKAEAMKNCTDPVKCGGMYWEPGVSKLQYKMEEFKKVSDDASLGFDIGSFDPYFDWKKEAAQKAKDLGYEVKRDTPNGRWIIHDSNGQLVQGGLESLFGSLYGDDPRVQRNYETQSYVTRKNYSRANALQFGSEEEAEKAYIMKNINQGLRDTTNSLAQVTDSYNQVNSTFLELNKKINNGVALTPKEQQIYDLASKRREELDQSKNSIQIKIDSIQKNIDMNDIDSLRRRADSATASILEHNDIEGLAYSLANIKKEQTIKVNEYTKMYEEFGLQKKLAEFNALLDIQKMGIKYGYDEKLEKIKKGIETGQIPTVDSYSVEGAPWGTAKQNIDDTPDLFYKQDLAERNNKFVKANDGSAQVLYQLYQDAKRAQEAKPNESAGATDFINKFGKSKITDLSTFKKALADNKLIAISLFTNISAAASTKDNPTGNYSWARPLLYAKGGIVDEIKYANDAFYATFDANLKTNIRTANAVAGTVSAENPVARFANLLVSKSGLIEDEDSFVKKYINAYDKRHITVTADKAKDAYKALTKQFYNTYNAAYNTSMQQGEGLAGRNGTTATPQTFTELDLLKKGSEKTVTDIIQTTNTAIGQFATTVVAIGDPSAETFKQGTNPKVTEFLTWYLNHSGELTDKSKHRMFTGTISNVAANDATKAAITFKGIDPAIIRLYEAYTGKEKNSIKEDLSKGITVFWDKTKLKSPFERPMGNLETLMRLTGHAKSIGFQDIAGTVDWNYDKETKLVTPMWTPWHYNDDGVWSAQEAVPIGLSRDISNITAMQADVEARLGIWATQQEAEGKKWAAYNKAKKK